MKKVKIMLTAVTVLAVVGGALAFKAKTFQGNRFYTLSSNGQCTSPVDILYTTTDLGNQFLDVTITPTTDPCPSTKVKPITEQ
jgi:hypothetical protein